MLIFLSGNHIEPNVRRGATIFDVKLNMRRRVKIVISMYVNITNFASGPLRGRDFTSGQRGQSDSVNCAYQAASICLWIFPAIFNLYSLKSLLRGLSFIRTWGGGEGGGGGGGWQNCGGGGVK